MDDFKRKHRTLAEPFQRLRDAGVIPAADLERIERDWDTAAAILAAAETRALARQRDPQWSDVGRRTATAKDIAGRIAKELAPVQQTITATQGEHETLQRRAPHSFLQSDGTYRYADPTAPAAPDVALLRELRDAKHVEYLRSLKPSPALLAQGVAEDRARQIARRAFLTAQARTGDEGDDGPLAAVHRLPPYSDLVDDETRQAMADAHLQRHRLDVALEHSEFVAKAYRDLGTAIDGALADLGERVAQPR